MAPQTVSHFAIARLVAAGALLIGAAGAPYGYYNFMRTFVTVVGGYSAFRAHERRSNGWVWLLGGAAILFNPVVPLRLDRQSWAALDVIGALVFLLTFAGRTFRVRNNSNSAE